MYQKIKEFITGMTDGQKNIALMELLYNAITEDKVYAQGDTCTWKDGRIVGTRPSTPDFPKKYPSKRKKVFDTKESFIKKAQAVHGSTYDYDKVEYKRSSEKVVITCKIHGDFLQTPGSHISGCGCIKCSNIMPPTQEQFLERVLSVHKDTYDFSKAIYVSAHDKLCVVCKTHGEFLISPNSLYKGVGCPVCGGTKILTQDTFLDKCKKVHGDIYDYSMTKYNSYYTPVDIVCRIHGKFTQVASDHLHGRGCQECAKIATADASRKSLADFIAQSREVHGNKYDYSNVVYHNSKTKVSLTCPIHGEFEITPHSHLHGYGCKKCSPRSRGEARITELLSLWGIAYKKEVTFHDCLGTSQNSRLRFDFGIYTNEALILLIEYDGIQHYRPVFGYAPFNRGVKHDKMKDLYCKTHNIRLLRIPYWEFDNIEIILAKALKEQQNEQEATN